MLREQLRRFRGTSVAGKGESDDKPLTEEEKNLFKELLYAFNLNNHIIECSNTNFIVKNGKIASLIHDSVNVKEYLQEVIDKTEKEYLVNKKEAYDLNEFPFKFPSNCEKNQKTTVVANISRGALLNLKKLFIYGNEKKVKTRSINIEIVRKAVESKREGLVNSNVKKIEEEIGNRVTPHALVTTCSPDESALEYVPIKEYETGYCLNRDYSDKEVKSFLKERQCAKGTSKAGKGSSKAEEKTSDYYSMSEHTDHEESSPMQQQNSSQNTGGGSPKCNPSWSEDEGSWSSKSSNSSPESDEENTREISLKRRSQSPEDGGSPEKSLRRESNNSSSEEAGGLPRSNFSDSESELCMGFRGANLGRK